MSDFAIINGVVTEYGGRILLAVLVGQFIFGVLAYFFGIVLGYRAGYMSGLFRGRALIRRRERGAGVAPLRRSLRRWQETRGV